MSLFFPRNPQKFFYRGGWQQPFDHTDDRKFAVKTVEDTGILVVVKGRNLTPQDYESLKWFETIYTNGTSVLSYDGLCLKLEVEDKDLVSAKSNVQMRDLIVNCYEAIDLHYIDYTETMREKYFAHTFCQKKQIGNVTIEKLPDDLIFQKAPNVYVRPN